VIKIGFDVKNEYILYSYLTVVDGKRCLKSARTKDLQDCLLILPELEAINAFDE